jgi:O-antigen ligase
MPFVDPWYQASRFQGWATNPHQIGLLINPLPFICCYFFGQSKSFWNKVFIVGLFAGIISIGIATKSDSLMVSWSVTSFLLFNLIFWRVLEKNVSATYGIRVESIMKVVKVLLGIVFISLVINQVYGQQIFDTIEDVSSSENNQGDGRKELWIAGLEIVKSFPLFGLGPGSHISSVAGAIGEEGFAEAHNSFIDWTMAGGMFGLFFYLAFLLFVVKRIWNNHNYALFICAFLSIMVMSLFGFFLRHTIFWFYMAMFLAMTLPNQDTKQTFR